VEQFCGSQSEDVPFADFATKSIEFRVKISATKDAWLGQGVGHRIAMEIGLPSKGDIHGIRTSDHLNLRPWSYSRLHFTAVLPSVPPAPNLSEILLGTHCRPPMEFLSLSKNVKELLLLLA